MPIVGKYNTISLTATPVQVIPPNPGPGNYTVQLLNTGAGKLYIGETNAVGANAASFLVTIGLYSPALSATTPIWIVSDATSTVSIYCAPTR